MTLSRRTVTTVIDKLDGTDRTTARHRQRLGLEPKRKDWRPACDHATARARNRAFREGPRACEGSEGTALALVRDTGPRRQRSVERARIRWPGIPRRNYRPAALPSLVRQNTPSSHQHGQHVDQPVSSLRGSKSLGEGGFAERLIE